MRRWQLSVMAVVSRTRAFWVRLLPLVVGTAVATGILGLLAASQVTPAQQIESRIGGADGAATAGRALPAGGIAPDITVHAGTTTLTTELTSFVELAQPKLASVLYLETVWGRKPTAGRMELLSGRWPVEPGEVAVTPSIGSGEGSSLRSVVGPNTLTVVGIANLTYSSHREAVLAAPGTWAAWPVTRAAAERADLTANRQLLFEAPDPAGTCERLLADKSLAGDGLSCETRQSAMQEAANESPVRFLLEQGLPALGVQLLGAVLCAGLLTRLLRRTMKPLADVGLSSRALRITGLVQAAIGGAIATIAGVLAGVGLALLLRPLLASKINHPLSPVVTPGSALLGSILALVVTVTMVRPQSSRRQHKTNVLSDRALRASASVGCLLIALAVVASIQLPQTLSTVAVVAVSSSVGFGLLAPQMLLSTSTVGFPPGQRLAAVRALGSNSRTYAVHVTLMATLVGVLCSTLAMVSGLIANLNQISGTGIPPGMVLLNTDEDGRTRLGDDTVQEFERSLELSNPIRVWQGVDEAQNGDQTPWWAFESVQDAQLVFPGLSQAQLQALAAGRLSLRPDAPTGPLDRSHDLRWLLELRTATEKPSDAYAESLLYLGLTPDQDKSAAGWAQEHSLASGYVKATDVARDLPIPQLTAAAALAFAICVGLMSSVATRGELSELRGLLAAFNALGLGRRWCFGTITILSLMLSILGVLLGWCSALLTTLLVWFLLDGSLLLGGLPWLVFGAIGLGAAVGGALGGALSSYRFAAQEVNGR